MANSTGLKKLSFADLSEKEASEVRGGESVIPIKGDPAVADPGLTDPLGS